MLKLQLSKLHRLRNPEFFGFSACLGEVRALEARARELRHKLYSLNRCEQANGRAVVITR